MDLTNNDGWQLLNLSKINIILGKNGCGKSTFLRSMKRGKIPQPDHDLTGKISYLSPERAGELSYSPGVDQSMTNDIEWKNNVRDQNQPTNFREQSVSNYATLELLVGRHYQVEVEAGRTKPVSFSFYVQQINSLLNEIVIQPSGRSFKVLDKKTGSELAITRISSGEKELITLGIECLVFANELENGKNNFLFIDEPDVHLHPDLQVKLMDFIRELVELHGFNVVLSTHSTAILGALEGYEHINVCFMTTGDTKLKFTPISEVYRKILPVFGAHPLSNIFNEAPLLLVEGEDDVRVWQQAVRTSSGKINLFPCSCDTVAKMNEYEEDAKSIMKAIYDDAVAYSLRDGDDKIGQTITDDLPVIRFRLNCCEVENLLLTEEVLKRCGVSWEELKLRMETWVSLTPGHKYSKEMDEFIKADFPRRTFKIKNLVNIFLGLLEVNKPWEIVVGQTIGELDFKTAPNFSDEGSIQEFLGEKAVIHLLM